MRELHPPLLRSVPAARSDRLERPLTVDDAFRAFGAYVAKIGSRILGNDDEIDDLVQEVFAEAAAGRQHFDTVSGTKGWLSTVTVRVAVRRLRVRRVRRFFRLDDALRDGDVPWPGASPEQCTLISQVYALLSRLPARQHVAWVLRRVEGDSLEEVSRKCRCSLATTKRMIASAQSFLERNVNDDRRRLS
jgi:RNA polymerase sigma-70 factor (ECF subfamily)